MKEKLNPLKDEERIRKVVTLSPLDRVGVNSGFLLKNQLKKIDIHSLVNGYVHLCGWDAIGFYIWLTTHYVDELDVSFGRLEGMTRFDLSQIVGFIKILQQTELIEVFATEGKNISISVRLIEPQPLSVFLRHGILGRAFLKVVGAGLFEGLRNNLKNSEDFKIKSVDATSNIGTNGKRSFNIEVAQLVEMLVLKIGAGPELAAEYQNIIQRIIKLNSVGINKLNAYSDDLIKLTEYTFSAKQKESLESFESAVMLKRSFNIEQFLKETSQIILPFELRTKYNLDLIAWIAETYSLSIEQMIQLIGRNYSVANAIDFDKLEKMARLESKKK